MAPRRPSDRVHLPLVYSCSGCSNVAQLANRVAVSLDREGVVEMSCVAGVGGGVASLVRKAQSGRFIVVLDGCPLRCANACLQRVGVQAQLQLTLSDLGLRKRDGEDCDAAELELVRQALLRHLAHERAS